MTDPRVTCTACANYRGNRCHRALAAGLSMIPKRPVAVAEIGSQFAALPQNCSAHTPRTLHDQPTPNRAR